MQSESIYRNAKGEIISQGEYEEKMFRTATSYKVAFLEGQYKLRGLTFEAWPLALVKALAERHHCTLDLTRKPPMLYVVKEYTDCLIPVDKWEHYLTMYGEMTGQVLSWAKVNAVAREIGQRAYDASKPKGKRERVRL